MPLVTFNENVDHYAKGDIVKLSADELKAIDLYAETHEITKPYSKGEQQVSNTDDTPNMTDTARENSLKRSKVAKDPNAKTDETPTGSVASQDALIENANKQAVGETLPDQDGDNPTGAGLEGDADVETEDESDDEDEAEETTTTDEVTDDASELEVDTAEPAVGTDKVTPAVVPAKPAAKK